MTFDAQIVSYIQSLKKVSLRRTTEGPLAVNVLQVSWSQVVVRKVIMLRENTETLRRT